MSKTLEEIIAAPSLVREQWLSPELAVREVLAFERRFGSKHLMLACHAALPLILTPELLNLIHINFLEEEQIPWVAEVDFLLSPLCRPIDEGLFEVEPSIREVLLVELENQFGFERPFGLAKFLQVYLAHKSGWKQRSEVTRTQQWIAQAYINPDQVIDDLTNLLESSLSEENYLLSLPKQIQVATTLEVLAEPLERINQRREYQYLIGNSRALAQILYGDEQELKQAIKQEVAEGDIVARALMLLSPFMLKQLIGEGNDEPDAPQEELEYAEGILPPLFKKVEGVFVKVQERWNLKKLYLDLSFAKQQLTLSREKQLTLVEKQYLHALLCIDIVGYLSFFEPEEIDSLETDLNIISLYRYIEVITKQPKTSLTNWRDATLLLAEAGYGTSIFSTLRTKITDAEMLKASLRDLGITVKNDADVRGSRGERVRADIVAVLEGEYDLGWSRNSDGTFDLIANLWGVARKHNHTELIGSINQKYAVNKTLANSRNRGAIKRKPKCPRCDSPQVVKYGYYNYKQNYKCQNCDNQFLES